jgi:hypothetical protein
MSLLLNFYKDSLGSNLDVLLVDMMFLPCVGSFFFSVSYFLPSSLRLLLFSKLSFSCSFFPVTSPVLLRSVGLRAPKELTENMDLLLIRSEGT